MSWGHWKQYHVFLLLPHVTRQWPQESPQFKACPVLRTLGQVSPQTPLAIYPEETKGNTGRPRWYSPGQAAQLIPPWQPSVLSPCVGGGWGGLGARPGRCRLRGAQKPEGWSCADPRSRLALWDVEGGAALPQVHPKPSGGCHVTGVEVCAHTSLCLRWQLKVRWAEDGFSGRAGL